MFLNAEKVRKKNSKSTQEELKKYARRTQKVRKKNSKSTQEEAMNNNEEKKEKAVSWLEGLLTGWGIKESWAKVIAGAIIGGLLAAGWLTGCTATYSQNADGSVNYSGSVVLPESVLEGK